MFVFTISLCFRALSTQHTSGWICARYKSLLLLLGVRACNIYRNWTCWTCWTCTINRELQTFQGTVPFFTKIVPRVTFDTFLWRMLSRIWLFHDMDMSEYYYCLYTKTLLIHCMRRVPWDRMCSLIKCLLKGHFRHDQSRPFHRAWNCCPSLRWTQWLNITGPCMQQQRIWPYHVVDFQLLS